MTTNVRSHNFSGWRNTGHILKESSEHEVWLAPAALIYSKGWRQKIIGFCNAQRKTEKVIVKGLFHAVCLSACLPHSNIQSVWFNLWSVSFQIFTLSKC